jgi:hypothetical protein
MVEEKAPVTTLGTEIGCDGDSLASTVDEVQRGRHAESGGTKGGARRRSAPFIAIVMGEDGGVSGGHAEEGRRGLARRGRRRRGTRS